MIKANDRIKVLHILNTGAFSGAENVVVTIMNQTRETIDARYVSLEGNIREVLEEREINYIPISSINPWTLTKLIKKERPDIIHAHDFTASISAALMLTRIPVISHLHHNSPWLKRINLRSIMYGLSCFRYNKILTVSSSVMDEFIFGSFFSSKTKVISNPVDSFRIKYLSERANPVKSYDLAFLGRLTEAKNPEAYLHIVSELKKEHTNIQALILGNGELLNEIKEQIRYLNLEKNIELKGFQKNPYIYLKKAKILCMPSRWEGFGLAAVEALSLGLPILASEVGGLPTIVDESCGKLCHSINDFVDAANNLLRDEILFLNKSEGALKRSQELDNIPEYMETLSQIYESCIGENNE